MADSMYRRPTTLQDLLLGANAGIAPPVAPAQPPPDNQDYGLLTADKRNQLMDALLQPTTLGPEPTIDKRSIGSEIFAGLGDALGAYAAGINGGPRPQYGNEYYGKLDRQKAERDQFRKQAALLEAQNRQRSAEILLSNDDRARIKADDRAARKELKDMTIAQQEADRKARVDAAAQAAQYHADEITSREKIAKMETDARIHSDNLQAGLHRDKKTEDADKEQHTEYKQVRMWAVAKKGEILKSIQSGEVTTDQVRQQISDMLDASDLTGKYRDAAAAFLESQIGVPLAKHDFAQQYEPQGPDRPGNLPVPRGTPTLRNPRGVGGGI